MKINNEHKHIKCIALLLYKIPYHNQTVLIDFSILQIKINFEFLINYNK